MGKEDFIRDVCSVGWNVKSEVRRRLEELLKEQREEIIEEIEKHTTETFSDLIPYNGKITKREIEIRTNRVINKLK